MLFIINLDSNFSSQINVKFIDSWLFQKGKCFHQMKDFERLMSESRTVRIRLKDTSQSCEIFIITHFLFTSNQSIWTHAVFY